MRIAFWGIGSIAKRHIKNLSFVLQKRGQQAEIDLFRHNSRILEDGSLRGLIANVFMENELKGKFYDIIFITNPTSMHYETIKKCVPYTKHLFIEKPVFEDCEEDMTALQLKQGAVYYVACPLRYTSVFQYVKKNVDLSSVFSVRAFCSSYLPDWRPGQDYRDTYSAHRDLGGGVAIDLIHEWDYLCTLFGYPEKLMYAGGKFSALEIDSDDAAAYIGVYHDKLIELHLDYFGRKTARECVFYTPEEVIRADFTNGCVQYLKSDETVHLQEDRDAYQIRELEHFLDIIDGKCGNDSTIEHGIQVLRIAKGMI